MSDAFCSDCKRQTEVVLDHAVGDTICSECGLVLDSHSIDKTSEWRIFANESGGNDPVRVGGPSITLLNDGVLSTVIAMPNGSSGEFLLSSRGRWQIHAGDLMRRFCSKLGMNNQAVKAAQEAVQKSEEFDIRRSPMSIAAAVIYIITQLSDDKKTLKEISVATGVAELTIRYSYKDHYPYVSKIIPNWYAKEEDLKNLCSP